MFLLVWVVAVIVSKSLVVVNVTARHAGPNSTSFTTLVLLSESQW